MEDIIYMLFLFASQTTNILVTVGIVILLALGTFFIVKIIKKKGDTLKKLPMALLYLTLFILYVGGIVFGLYTWNFDFSAFINDFFGDVVAFILDKIGDIILTIVIILIVSFLLKLLKVILNKSAEREGPNQKRRITMLKVTNSLINYTVKIITLLVILAIWGINVLPALAGLGILGLVVGLGAQSLIKDFIAGFFIIFEHHFDVGDVVEINGFKGKVVDIGLKTTRVQNWKNAIKIFANGVITEPINYSKNPSVAVIEFGIAYGEDVQKTIDILNQELPKYQERFPDILEAPTVLGVTQLADSSVNMRVIIKTATETHYGIERGFLQIIKEILDKNNIEIPFPQVVVHKGE
jgi:small conductance mechanosensitive channel